MRIPEGKMLCLQLLCVFWCLSGCAKFRWVAGCISQSTFQERPNQILGDLKMHSLVCWVITLLPLLTCFQRYGEWYCHHLQGRNHCVPPLPGTTHQTRREDNPQIQSSAAVKNQWNYTSTLPSWINCVYGTDITFTHQKNLLFFEVDIIG